MARQRLQLETLEGIRDDLAGVGLDVSLLDTLIETANMSALNNGEDPADIDVKKLLDGFLDPDFNVDNPAADVMRTLALQLRSKSHTAAIFQQIIGARSKSRAQAAARA